MPAFTVLPLSEFPGLVSVLKRQGEEYRRLKAAGVPLTSSWIIPASSLENILRQNGKQILLRELLVSLSKSGNKNNLKLKNQIRRLITHLTIDGMCKKLLKLYHQTWSTGKIHLQAVLPYGESIFTQPEKGDANLIQALLMLWAKSCMTHVFKSSTITQLAPSIVITHTPSPQWLGELYCRHPRALKHNAVIIRVKANRKNGQITEFQIDSQTLQNISRPITEKSHESLFLQLVRLLRPTHQRRLNSALRQLAHIGGKLSRMTTYPVKAQFIIGSNGPILTEVNLMHTD